MNVRLKISTLFSFAMLVIAGCSSSSQKPVEMQPPEKAQESRTHVFRFATGYCKGLSETRDEKNDIYAGMFKTPEPNTDEIVYAAGYCKNLLEKHNENFETHASSTYIIQYAAGYCTAVSGKQSEDFKRCFIQQTDLLMEQAKAHRSKEDEDGSVVLSQKGHEVMYVKRIYSGVENMTQEQVGWSKAFGTYDNVRESNAIEQGSVWVGTKTVKTGNKCIETTSSVAEIPKGPGEPRMNTVDKEVPCPN